MAMNYPADQYVESGIDLRLQQQIHFAQPSVLKLSQKPIIYYQDTQPENSLIPSQFNRNSYRQATLSDYDGKCLPDGDQSPPLSHYSGVTAKSEPHWRHNARQNHQLNHSDYQTQRRPSPHIPQSEMQPNSQQNARHFRYLSQEICRGAPHSEYNDTISQPSLLGTQPDRQSYFNQYPPQSTQLTAQHELQVYENSCDAYPPYYHPSKQLQQPQTVPQNATFHPNPNYKFRSQELHTPKRAPNYSSSIISHNMQHKVLHGEISSVPALHRALSPTEAKAQELFVILVTSQEITSLCRAATTIQQMTYGDDAVKAYFREVGAIQALISHLQSRQDSVLSSTLGALRNLSYGVELNKRVIASGWGLSNLMQLLVRTQLPELRELTTCVLWNVSSSAYLKKGFLDICLDDLVRSSVIPLANWDTDSVPLNAMDPSNPSHVKWNAELKNSTGILRNLTSFGKDCRIRLRGCEGLVDSILYIICSALGRDDVDNQIVENCVCILRNLSYRLESEVDLQEGTEERQIRWETPEPISNPNYTTNPDSEQQSRRWFRYFCVSFKRNPRQRTKSNPKSLSPQKSITPSKVNQLANLHEKVNGNTYDHLQKGISLLWQPEIVDMYILILKECSNRVSIEATLGAILNLSACEWKWASYTRTAFRNKKGLPLIVKIITTTDNELTVKSACTALRFLSYDWSNKLLIGDYALAHLVERLPGGKHFYGLNDTCYQSILSAVNELIQKCPDNINHLYMNKSCIPILAKLACNNNNPPKTIYLANKVCLYLFEDNLSRPVLKKEGWSISNWQKVVDWLEKETSSTPSDSQLSGPYGSKNPSLTNAFRPRAKSDTIAEKKTTYLHRTLDVDQEGSLFRESTIASGSSRVTQQTDSQQPYNKQKRIDPHTAIMDNFGRNQFATYNPHKRLQQAISYPEAALRHPLEQVHRDSPVSFTSNSPGVTPLQPDDSNLANSRNYCYVPDLCTQQQATDPRITPLDPRLGGECQVEREHKRTQRTPSPNPSVTTGQEESKESIRFELKEEQVKQRDVYSKVDIKKKRERRFTAHVRPEDLPHTNLPNNLTKYDQTKLDKLPSKYNPVMAPQLPLNARPKDLGRMVNLRFEQPQATDSWTSSNFQYYLVPTNTRLTVKMYGNQILCDRVYGSLTQTNCFKHLYKTLYDNRPKDNSCIPTLRGFLESYGEKFKIVFFENLSSQDSHSFYHGLLKFDNFMDHICQIQDVSIEDCDTSKRECWKIFYLANKNEIRKINHKNFPDSVLYQLWLIYCKLDVKGELKVPRTIFNEFIGKLMEKSDLKAPKPRNDPSLKSHLNFPTFFNSIQEQCLDKLPRDYGMVIVTEIYDTLFKGSLKQGYIYKSGKHMGSSRRWFMLTPDSLLYYDAKLRTNQTESKGIIYISVYSNVRTEGCSSKMDKFYFSLTCTRSKKRFNLYCEDATERHKWIKSINAAIASQAHQASISTLQRQDLEIGLEKWSFNYLLGLLDSLSPINIDSPNMQSAARWASTRDLNAAEETSISNNRDDTLKRKSVDWGRPDSFNKMSAPVKSYKGSSIVPPISPRPTVRLIPRRPPACSRQASGYMEMNIPDTATGYSSGYSSSNGSKSDEELDDFIVKPRYPERNTMHIDNKQQKPKSPKVLVRRNSGYVDMHIPSSTKDIKAKVSFDIDHPLESIRESDPIRSYSMDPNVSRRNVQDLIKKYAPPVPERKPRSLPSSPNPNSKLSADSSKDSYGSDTPELSQRSKTATCPVNFTKPNTKDLIVTSSKFLNIARVKSKSQDNLILI